MEDLIYRIVYANQDGILGIFTIPFSSEQEMLIYVQAERKLYPGIRIFYEVEK